MTAKNEFTVVVPSLLVLPTINDTVCTKTSYITCLMEYQDDVTHAEKYKY